MKEISWYDFSNNSPGSGRFIIIQDHEGNQAFGWMVSISDFHASSRFPCQVLGHYTKWTPAHIVYESGKVYYNNGQEFVPEIVSDLELSFEGNAKLG